MKISIGADHGGFDLKEDIKKYLQNKGYEIDDVGCYSKESIDYPVYGKAVARKVSDGSADRGILICTTGIGMSITANRFKNVRAALCLTDDAAKMSRAHNDANLLVFGAKYVPARLAQRILDIWFTQEFEGGRHQRRIDQIDEI